MSTGGLANPAVLSSAVQDGLSLLTWEKDSFAYADDFDEKVGRYRGLRHSKLASLSPDAPTGLLVRAEIAKQQLDAETKPPTDTTKDIKKVDGPETDTESKHWEETSKHGPKRFHGYLTLDPTRVRRDAGRVTDEIVSHPSGASVCAHCHMGHT